MTTQTNFAIWRDKNIDSLSYKFLVKFNEKFDEFCLECYEQEMGE